ncbi:MAG: elongation factor G [Gammaproteobacteria bacterium]|nr:MAG: elongation factor G [Gammaproteobacteria bacterium]
MPKYKTENIRNIAFTGHVGSGKTTLLEALLHKAGAIGQMGSLERGSMVTDHDPLEKDHQHSLQSSLVSLDHGDTHINIIDTPGLPDFRGQTAPALSAVETVAIVVNAQSGIESTTMRLMERAKKMQRCRMIIINKINAEGVDLEGLVRDIRDTFGNECLPVNLPADGGKKVVDVFFKSEGEADIFSIDAAHTEITDQVVEVDEALMESYLEKGELEPEQLHAAFERALREGHLVPICFASGRDEVGIGALLDFFAELLPNPAEGNPPVFFQGQGDDAKEVTVEPDPAKHVVAHVFKITNDPFVGKLSMFRIYQGTVTKDSQLFIGDARKPFKVGHLFEIQGKEHKETDAGIPGDICAVAKVEEITFDAVLHDSHDEDHFHLKPIRFALPMFGLAVEPKSRGMEQKLSGAIQKLGEEDPCFQVDHNVELNETVIRGLGDLHLRVMLERMNQRYNVEVITRPPRIAYRETVTRKADGHFRHKKQTGGAGQFAEVFLRIEPMERGSGFEFKSEVVGGNIPTVFIPAVEKGVIQAMDEGAIAGYHMQDMRVIVYDGKHHPVDSKEIAFITAGKKAFLDAVRKASPVVLEPIVRVEITAPENNMGDIAGGLSGKRGRVSGSQSMLGGVVSISAQAPLAEMISYHSELKSVTGGEGSYTMDFSHYDPVPATVQKELANAYKPREEE